ncbi:cidABC operon transcriptional activator CidR [Pontibacillus yanchengensis]|uniref:LysR family transcriptional regulator n=1 Tax=Pontibacillus yanchengensis Y32 TaxID=1385514 RepID=A0A0A2TJ67_9BACI|nr:LysR family transcriptional regulator [Pontibacillus yanchengensis]KGP74126.1 LysR family transcriptional regulator [Pontibacillus yanchengensis Y32]
MDIRHLQYFIEVSRFSSFTKAAEHLFITQPTISKMIKNLEMDLGVELFDRSKKQLVLTDAGRIILVQAQTIDKAFQNLETEVDNLLGLNKGHIRIGLPPIIDSHKFMDLLRSFHDQYPNITFQLVEDGSKRVEDDVRQDQLDIGIVVLPTQEDIFHYFPFIKEDIKLVVPPSHPLAHRQEVELQALRQEAFIMFNNGFVLHDRILSSCNQAGFNPYIISESSQWYLIEEMVASELGVALLPESICNHLQRNLVTINVTNPSIPYHLAMIWQKDQYLSYATKEWLRFTQDKLSDDTTNV